MFTRTRITNTTAQFTMPCLVYLLIIQLNILRVNFDLIPKVRSLGQVKVGTSPRRQHQSSISRSEHSSSPNDLKLSMYITGMDTNKTFISDLPFSWPQVRLFLTTDYEPMGE